MMPALARSGPVRRRTGELPAMVVALALACGPAWGQQRAADEHLPDLDELLGLEPDEPAGPGGAVDGDDVLSRRLDRQLTPGQIDDRFREAVALMDEAADRIERARDTGVSTQRLQEEILRKLEQLISDAQQSSSSRGAAGREREGSSSPPDQPGAERSAEARRGDNVGEPMPPPPTEVQRGPAVAAGADWGALPARVRDALLQGHADTFSSLYRALTEAYYRRLAEEGSP